MVDFPWRHVSFPEGFHSIEILQDLNGELIPLATTGASIPTLETPKGEAASGNLRVLPLDLGEGAFGLVSPICLL